MGKIYFISDVHLRPHHERRESYFISFLDAIRGAEALYMLGDIFDYWVGVGQLRKALDDPVFNSFRKLSQSGTKIRFIGGNRDFLMGNELTRACGVEVMPESLDIKLDGRRIHLTHGDLFCSNDADYMMFRSIVRNPVLKYSFKHLTPLTFRLWVARLMRRSSRAIVKNKAKKIRDIDMNTVARCFAKGYDIIICGHVHRPGHVEMNVRGKERHLYTLDHWNKEPTCLVYEDGVFTFQPDIET